MGTLHCKSKEKNLQMEEAKKAKRERERYRLKARVDGRHSLDVERSGVVSKSVTLLMRISPYNQDLRQFKSTILST